jgi:hypothetical protein
LESISGVVPESRRVGLLKRVCGEKFMGNSVFSKLQTNGIGIGATAIAPASREDEAYPAGHLKSGVATWANVVRCSDGMACPAVLHHVEGSVMPDDINYGSGDYLDCSFLCRGFAEGGVMSDNTWIDRNYRE